MQLEPDECWRRLGEQRHATFSTVRPTRGVDAVPVVFVVVDRRIVIPIDTVKPKRTTRLQRLENLRADDRCALLVDRYDDEDWSQLWWVRVHGRAAEAAATPDVLERFAARYPPYADPTGIVTTIVLTPELVTGWAASG